MRMITLLTFAILLSGCSFFNEPKPVAIHKGYYRPNPLLTIPIKPHTPPSKDRYMRLSQPDRERALTIYGTQLLKDLAKANNRLKAIDNIYVDKGK